MHVVVSHPGPVKRQANTRKRKEAKRFFSLTFAQLRQSGSVRDQSGMALVALLDVRDPLTAPCRNDELLPLVTLPGPPST